MRALSVIVTLPNLVPLAAGVKVTSIVQLAAAVSVPPSTQVLADASAKSPLTVKVDKVSDVVPLLVRSHRLGPACSAHLLFP
jgi:hypothetical protein